jgi:hypothetical protein
LRPDFIPKTAFRIPNSDEEIQMIRKQQLYYLGFFILLAALLAACGPPAPELEEMTEPAATTAPADAEETAPRPTVTPDPNLADEEEGEAGYPAQPAATAVPQEEGYPAPTPIPTIDPYPNADELVWVRRAAGEQCAESDPLEMREAMATLADAGIEVREQTSVEMAVCQACGCPTSLHFRAQIAPEDVPQATELGWQVEEE